MNVDIDVPDEELFAEEAKGTAVAELDGILLIPLTGEIVDLTDYKACALALDSIRELEWQLRKASAVLTAAIAAEAARLGVETLELDGGKVIAVGSS